jgi:serine/threonine protein kinase
VPDPFNQLREALADRYRLERELGRGGMATVYLAHDLKHKRDVAVKVLDLEVGATLGPERFQREIQLAAGLVHPHIVPVFDSGNAIGRLWYVMPYIRGESLRTRLERDGMLGVPAALRITREVAEALDYAHRHGVVHREVKPENILLADGQALLADFGIARTTVGAVTGYTRTASSLTLGTPTYMSPEQAGGETEVDGRSDVYSPRLRPLRDVGGLASVRRAFASGCNRQPAHGPTTPRRAVPTRSPSSGRAGIGAGAGLRARGTFRNGGYACASS